MTRRNAVLFTLLDGLLGFQFPGLFLWHNFRYQK